jgi:hypothetical protein
MMAEAEDEKTVSARELAAWLDISRASAISMPTFSAKQAVRDTSTLKWSE